MLSSRVLFEPLPGSLLVQKMRSEQKFDFMICSTLLQKVLSMNMHLSSCPCCLVRMQR